MTGEPFRWGILSTAQIGLNHVVPAIQRSRTGRVVAIASRDEGRAKEAAAAHGIASAHGSYVALLADPSVEAVYNPLPNHLHAEWTIRALEAGKHVLCEKPIGLDGEDARAIAAAARRTGRHVAEAFMVRHHPQWIEARRLVREGRIGTPRAYQMAFTYHLTDPANIRNQAEIGGGGLYDVGCYAINTARFLFEAEPERVVATFDRDPEMLVDRLASGIAEFPGGRHLSFVCGTQAALTQSAVLIGSHGRIAIGIPFNAPIDRPTRLVVDDGRDLFGTGAEVIEFPPCDQYGLQAEAFAAEARSGAPPDGILDDAIANMRVLDALFRSGRNGGWECP